jgi:hypothetical protein
MSRPLTILALVFALCALSTGAFGQTSPVEISEEIKREAAAHYHEGRRLFDQELYSAAIERFQQAQQLYPAPANLYNIAKCYERLGASNLCVESYQSYLRLYESSKGRSAPDVVDVRNAIEKCRLGARIFLSIESDPPGATVYLDAMDKVVGQTPYATHTDAGTYRLKLTLQGYAPFERTLNVRPGEPLKVVFKLEKFQASGKLIVRANILGAAIYVDGKNIGLTPFADSIALSTGSHQVTVIKDDYSAYASRIEIIHNQRSTVEATLFLTSPPATWKGYTGYTTLAVGVGSVVAGYFLGNRADTEFTGSEEFNEYAGDQKMAYGAGATLALTGVLLAIFETLDALAVKEGDAITYRPTSSWDQRFTIRGAP